MKTRIAALLTTVGLLLVMTPGLAAAKQEVCPEEGKVESVTDGDIDNIVLDAGTLVCIKAGTLVVTVEADGQATLAELIGNGKNVSHYTVIQEPPSTTTTTVPEETTTTVETSSTTVPETTTTVPEETTTTVPQETTTSEAVTTTAPSQTTTTVPTVTEQPELPYTGPEDIWLAGLGLALLAGGGALVRSAKD